MGKNQAYPWKDSDDEDNVEQDHGNQIDNEDCCVWDFHPLPFAGHQPYGQIDGTVIEDNEEIVVQHHQEVHVLDDIIWDNKCINGY